MREIQWSGSLALTTVLESIRIIENIHKELLEVVTELVLGQGVVIVARGRFR